MCHFLSSATDRGTTRKAAKKIQIGRGDSDFPSPLLFQQLCPSVSTDYSVYTYTLCGLKSSDCIICSTSEVSVCSV